MARAGASGHVPHCWRSSSARRRPLAGSSGTPLRRWILAKHKQGTRAHGDTKGHGGDAGRLSKGFDGGLERRRLAKMAVQSSPIDPPGAAWLAAGAGGAGLLPA